MLHMALHNLIRPLLALIAKLKLLRRGMPLELVSRLHLERRDPVTGAAELFVGRDFGVDSVEPRF